MYYVPTWMVTGTYETVIMSVSGLLWVFVLVRQIIWNVEYRIMIGSAKYSTTINIQLSRSVCAELLTTFSLYRNLSFCYTTIFNLCYLRAFKDHLIYGNEWLVVGFDAFCYLNVKQSERNDLNMIICENNCILFDQF